MNSRLLKRFCAVAVLALTGVLVSANTSVTTSSAQPAVLDDEAKGCSNETLDGNYGFTVHGQITTPAGIINRDGVAMTHFDGAGNLTQTDFVLSNGVAVAPDFLGGETGTYTVNADCTGSGEIDSHGAVIKLKFVLTNHGRQIHTVVSSLTPPGAPGPVPAAIHSDAEKE